MDISIEGLVAITVQQITTTMDWTTPVAATDAIHTHTHTHPVSLHPSPPTCRLNKRAISPNMKQKKSMVITDMTT